MSAVALSPLDLRPDVRRLEQHLASDVELDFLRHSVDRFDRGEVDHIDLPIGWSFMPDEGQEPVETRLVTHIPAHISGGNSGKPLPPLQEFFTEAEARTHVTCPNGRTAMPPLKCEGRTCGAWRWKKTGLDPERVEGPVGFCGVGGKP